MLRVMLFEDNPKSEYIKALNKLYANTDVRVDGSGSSSYLFNTAEDYLSEGADYIYMYKDFVANNVSSVSEYRHYCLDLVRRNLVDKIALIPIPCSEYYALLLYNYITASDIIDITHSNESYENCMKSTYRSIQCFKRRYKNGCRFWYDDCADPTHLNILLHDKELQFLMHMPVFMSGISDINITSVKLQDRIMLANNVCLQLSDMIGANTEHCREVLNMNPLLRIK